MIPEEILKLESAAVQAAQDGYPDQALEFRSEAIRKVDPKDQPRLLAALLLQMGYCYQKALNDPARAVLAFESGLKALEQIPDLHIDRVILEKRRMGKSMMGPEIEVEIPEIMLPAAVRDLETVIHDEGLVIDLVYGSATSYLRRNQDKPAEQDFQICLKRPEIRFREDLIPTIYFNLGLIHLRANAFDLAKKDAELIREETGGSAKADLIEGMVALEKKDYKLARDFFQNAIRQDQKDLVPGIQFRLGILEQELENWEIAIQHFDKCLEEVADNLNLKRLAMAGKGLCLRELGKAPQAINCLREAVKLSTGWRSRLMTDEGRVTFIDSVAQLFDSLIELLVDEGLNEEALEYAEQSRGKAMEALLGYARVQRPRIQWLEQEEEELPMLEEAGPPETDFSMMVSQMAITVSDSFSEADLREIEPVEASPVDRMVFHQLADALIIFFCSRDGEVFSHRIEMAEEQLGQKVSSLRRSMGWEDGAFTRGFNLNNEAFEGPDPEKLLEDLYECLIQPFWEQLKGVVDVLLEPQSDLWLLPFSCLRSKDGKYLSDQVNIFYNPSIRLASEIRAIPPLADRHQIPILVLADPEMPQHIELQGMQMGFKPLPGARKEAAGLKALGAENTLKVFLGKDASIGTWRNENRNFGIHHLSTHGLTFPNDPLASGVILASDDQEDGWLSARQIQHEALPSELVVLSACQTGMGMISGDGVIGLSRAFLVAGARSVLVSLWNVDDQATAALISRFYRHFLGGDSKSGALGKAMKWMREETDWKDPVFWAGFVLIGSEA